MIEDCDALCNLVSRKVTKRELKRARVKAHNSVNRNLFTSSVRSILHITLSQHPSHHPFTAPFHINLSQHPSHPARQPPQHLFAAPTFSQQPSQHLLTASFTTLFRSTLSQHPSQYPIRSILHSTLSQHRSQHPSHPPFTASFKNKPLAPCARP